MVVVAEDESFWAGAPVHHRTDCRNLQRRREKWNMFCDSLSPLCGYLSFAALKLKYSETKLNTSWST